MFTPLTEQQYNNAIKAGYTHDQIIQFEQQRKQEALAQDKTDLQNWQSPPVETFGHQLQNIGLGAVKGLMGTAQSATNIIGPITNRIAAPLTKGLSKVTNQPKRVQTNLQQTIPQSWQTTTNPTQKIGYGLEQVGEMLIPIGEGGKAAVSAIDEAGKSVTKLAEVGQEQLTKKGEIVAKEAGKIETKGLFKRVVQKVTPRDLERGQALKDIGVSAYDAFDKQISKINEGITKEADQLREGLKQSKATWSWKNLKGTIDAIDKPHLLSGDLEKAFNKTLNVVMDKAQMADKNLSGLLDVRQAFDREVEKQYPNLYNSETMTAIKQAVLKTRAAINDMIEKALPEGKTALGDSFKNSLKKQNLLFEAKTNIAEKAPKLGESASRIGKSIKYVKNHPVSTLLGGYGTEKLIESGIKKVIGK